MEESSSSSSSSSLELKLLYGKGITGFNFFQKLLIYAAVSISSDVPDTKTKLNQDQKQRTPADKEGDGSPEWNHEIRFDLKEIPFPDDDDVFLRIDLYHEGVMFGDKHIGEVRVPLRDLADEVDGAVRFVSYQVKGPDGKPNGILTFSYKLNGIGGDRLGGDSILSGITGYSIVEYHHQQSEESSESENPAPGIVSYPTLEEFDHPVPPPAASYYPPPESYYPPPPPQQPPVMYPMPPHPPGWPPGPPMHHHHHHHHHHAWGHDPYGGGEGWRRDPYAPSWTGR